MNYFLVLFVFSLTIAACSDKGTDNIHSSDYQTQKDTNDISINTNYPFGCSELINIKFPKHWENDPNNYGQLKHPEGNIVDSIGKFFFEINAHKIIKTPAIQNIEFIKCGDYIEQSYTFDSTLQKSVDSCRYRLPNIGVYECYYSFRREIVNTYSCAYGNLLLVNSTTRNCNVINLYYEGASDSHVVFRYFFINNDTITIYNGSFYDDGCYLHKMHIVSIDEEKISVKNVTQR
jgi:hypothetical protein